MPAININGRQQRDPLVDEVVWPSAMEHCAELQSEIAGLMDQVTKQTDRLAELKVARDHDPDAFYLSEAGAEDAAALEGVDAMTDATTALRTDYTRYTAGAGGASIRTSSTRRTGSSRHSSKNRRKEERKKASGKKGSVYEEEYLMKSLSQLCSTKLPELQAQVGAFLPVCIRLSARQPPSSTHDSLTNGINGDDDSPPPVDLFSAARTLQTSLTDFEAVLSSSVSIIWDVRESEIAEVERKLLEGGTDLFAQMGRGAGLGPGRLVVERPAIEKTPLWKLGIL